MSEKQVSRFAVSAALCRLSLGKPVALFEQLSSFDFKKDIRSPFVRSNQSGP